MKKYTMKTRHALLMSCISLMTCFAMLLGSTFAWFTDSVTSGVNRIVAGNLDVELYHKTAGTTADPGDSISGETKLFNVPATGGMILWEPGAMAYETFTVKNVGSLSLDYKLKLAEYGYNTVTEANGTATARSLLDVLRVAVVPSTTTTDRATLSALTTWTTLKDFIAGAVTLPTGIDGTLDDKDSGAAASESFTLVLYWPSDTEAISALASGTLKDNDYNLQNGKYASDATATTVGELYVNLGVTLVATQHGHDTGDSIAESDSFGPNYDVNATTADVTIAAATSGTETVAATSDTTLTALAAPSATQNITTVTIPAGATSTDTANTVAANKTVYIEVNTENKFAVSSSGNEAATVGIDLYVGDSKTTTEQNTLTAGNYYNVSTYITPGLENVTLDYGTTEHWAANATTEADVSNAATPYTAFYDSTTGKLVFLTSHFSDFEVKGEAVAYNATKDVAYNQTTALTSDQAVLKDAIVAASSGDTMKLLKDVTLGAWDTGSNKNVSINIDKNLTFDGASHTVTSTVGRGIWISEANVALTVKNMTLVGGSGFERSIQINGNITNATLNIVNVTTKSTMYAINVCDGATCNINISDSNITGWSALNLWHGGYNVNVVKSTLKGINNKSYDAKGWNNFATVVLEGDTTGQTNMHSFNNSVTLTGCNIIAELVTTGNKQQLIGFNSKSKNNTVTLNDCTLTPVGDVSYNNGTGNSLIINGEYQWDNFTVTPGTDFSIENKPTGTVILTPNGDASKNITINLNSCDNGTPWSSGTASGVDYVQNFEFNGKTYLFDLDVSTTAYSDEGKYHVYINLI